eukprot:COSAG01_NODE_6651_length_3557_cov_2.387702_1_plen_1094_part_10
MRERVRKLVAGNELGKARCEALSERILANVNAQRLAHMLGQQRWEAAAALLEQSPGLLMHGEAPAVGHAELGRALLHASTGLAEHILATAPSVARRLDEGQFELLRRQTLSGTAALGGIDLRSPALGGSACAALALLARGRRLPTLDWAGLQLGDGGARQLVHVLAAGDEPSAVTSLDLRQNGLTTLPLELLQLPALTELRFGENPGLDPTLAKVLSTQGLPGLLKMLPDLHGDPKPSYVLKTVLAGPSMAGKTSLFKALRGLHERLTHPEHGRTIGLDIGRLELRDARAGRYVVIFLIYDAGGHDEYQEMHQTFLSHNTLYILVWNVAMDSSDHQLEEKMASWATLLQTCAPGSRVLLVASHADEVEDPSVIPGRCQRMTTAVRGMLDQHRAEQQRELDRLAALPATGNEQARKQLLEEVLKKPLQLADRAIVVSAATLEGIPELRQRMLGAAFDKSSFPSFGSNQPNTYLNILRQARQNHGDQLSVTMAEMQASLSVEPDVSVPFEVRLVRSTVVNPTADNTGRLHQALDAAKHARWDELQAVLFPDGSDTCVLPARVLNSVPHPRNYGLLHHLAYSGAVDAYQALLQRGILFDSTLLTSKGETVQTIAEERQHPEFVELLRAVDAQAATDPASTEGTLSYRVGTRGGFSSGAAKITSAGVLTVGSETADLTTAGTTVATEPPKRGQLFRVKVSLVDPARQLFLSLDSAEEQQRWLAGMQPFVSVESTAAVVEYTFTISLCGEVVNEMVVQHSIAKNIHTQLAKKGLCAGLPFSDTWKDYISDMVHDEENVARRGRELLTYYQALFARADTLAAFAPIMGFDLEELRKQRCQLAERVSGDPELLGRAMVYLTNAGEVLSHDLASSDRVFLEPQRLVDVMKELVHHDLQAQLEQIGAAEVGLGQRFLRRGILQRRLLPWLWRNLKPPVAGDQAQIDFLLGLLVQLGLLTRLPGVEPPQWILPMRLPDRRTALAAADARKQFASFLQAMDAGQATPAAKFSQVVDCIARAGVLPAEALEHGCAVALAKAKEILGGGELDAAGLSCDEIAAINFYTQEHMELPKDEDAPVNVYYPMNTAQLGDGGARQLVHVLAA